MLFKSFFISKEDKNLLEYLYNNYKQIMYYIALKILKNSFDAEDAVSEAFIKIIKHLDKIDIENYTKTKSFLIVVTKHISIDIYRKRNKENTLPIEDFEYSISTNPIEHHENMRDLISLMKKLPDNYYNVLILKYYHGFNDDEISKILDISKENVRKRITRAKHKLSEILEKEKDNE